MALDISGLTLHAPIGDGEHIVARLPAELGVTAPQWDRIGARFYEDPHLVGPAEVAQWRAELVAIRAGWGRRRRAELIRERQVRGKVREIVDRIVRPMLAEDRTLDPDAVARMLGGMPIGTGHARDGVHGGTGRREMA